MERGKASLFYPVRLRGAKARRDNAVTGSPLGVSYLRGSDTFLTSGSTQFHLVTWHDHAPSFSRPSFLVVRSVSDVTIPNSNLPDPGAASDNRVGVRNFPPCPRSLSKRFSMHPYEWQSELSKLIIIIVENSKCDKRGPGCELPSTCSNFLPASTVTQRTINFPHQHLAIKRGEKRRRE